MTEIEQLDTALLKIQKALTVLRDNPTEYSQHQEEIKEQLKLDRNLLDILHIHPSQLYGPGVYLIKNNELSIEMVSELKTWEAIAKEIVDYEDRERVKIGGYSKGQRILSFLRKTKDSEMSAIAALNAFYEDTYVWMRAFSMIISSALVDVNSEKDARLRGALVIIESATRIINSLKNIAHSTWHDVPDIFQSDYSVSHLKKRIYELQDELKKIQPDHPLVQGDNLNKESSPPF